MFHLATPIRLWPRENQPPSPNSHSHSEPQIRGGELSFDNVSKPPVPDGESTMNRSNSRFKDSRCVEFLLKLNHDLGLSPCYISREQIIKVGRINKIVFLGLTGIVLSYTVINLRYFAWWFFHNKKPLGRTRFYLAVCYHTAIAIQTLRYAEVTLKMQPVLKRLTGLLQQPNRTPCSPRNFVFNPTKFFRILSILISIFFSVSGLEALHSGTQWSFQTVLNTHAVRFFTGIHSTPIPLLSSSNGSCGTATAAEDEVHIGPISGWNIYQWFGLLFNVIHLVVSSTPLDFLLISVFCLWIHTHQLNLHLSLAATREEEVSRELLKSEFEGRLQQYNLVRAISKELNQVLSKLLPSTMLICMLQTSYFFHLLIDRDWVRLLYYGIRLCKAFGTIQLALWITEHNAAYSEWFKADETQNVLQLESSTLTLKLDELNQRPVGVGSGIYYIYDGFVASFLTIVSSYFFIVSEAMKGRQECHCNCGTGFAQ